MGSVLDLRETAKGEDSVFYNVTPLQVVKVVRDVRVG